MAAYYLSKLIASKYFIIFAVLFTVRNVIDLLVGPKSNPYARGEKGRFSLLILAVSSMISGISAGCFLLIGGAGNLYSYFAGLLLMMAAYLGRRLTIKALGNNYSYSVKAFPDHELVTFGIYSVIRNPIYLLHLMEMIAFVIIKFNYVSLIALISGITATLYRIKEEEELLSTVFGEQFRAYSKKTKRLVPFIY